MGFALCSRDAFFCLGRAGASVKVSSSAVLVGTFSSCSSQMWPGTLGVIQGVPPR